MARIINASIDLTKIDKSKIVSTNKDGQPFANGAKYLNIQIAINDQANQYGQDCAIWINQTKAERDAQAARNYIGNGKTSWSDENAAQPAKTSEAASNQYQAAPVQTNDDDIPF
jgi:hypothetical protein